MAVVTYPTINPGAETGDLTGWTVSVGSWSVGDPRGDPVEGIYAFLAEDDPCEIYQEWTVDPAQEANIDAGTATARISLQMYDYGGGWGDFEVWFRFYDGVGTLLAEEGSGRFSTNREWQLVERQAILPVGTRVVRFAVYCWEYIQYSQFDDVSDLVINDQGVLFIPVDLQWALIDGDFVLPPDLDLRWRILEFLEEGVSLAWRVGTTEVWVCELLGAVSEEALLITPFDGERGHDLSAHDLPRDLVGDDQPASVAPLSFYVLPATIAGTALGFAGDYYYRIWVLPDTMTLQNPQIGAPVPFGIWNAYPWPNTLNTIVPTDATGITLDLTAPSLFREIEYVTVNVTIGPLAPIQIDASWLFDFEDGDGVFYLEATIADFLQMVPAPPVLEHWDWLTDIIRSWGSQEQRIALREAPRRSISYSLILKNDAHRRLHYRIFYKNLATRLVLPYYQYYTELTQALEVGEDRIYFDYNDTDVRDGEFVIILNSMTEEGSLVKLGTVGVDDLGDPLEGAMLDTPSTFEAPENAWISPAFTSRLKDGSGFVMRSRAGEIKIDAQVLDVRSSFKRPGSSVTLTTFNGYPVLEERPLANENVPDNFFVNYEVIDSQTGLINIKTAWPHPFKQGKRKYLVQRGAGETDMDFWRDFLYEIRGMQNPFLTPTFWTDLLLAEAPSPGSTQMIVKSTEYMALYFPYESYKRLRLELANGTVLYRKVLLCSADALGTLLELDDSFGVNPEDVDIIKISFLNLVRLDKDRVSLTHYYTYSYLELALRAVDQ